MSDTFRVWLYDDVRWGETPCEAPACFREAVVLADFDESRRVGVPLCPDDAWLLLDRSLALAHGGAALAALLPDAWEHSRPQRGRRPPGLSDWELADRSPEKWLAEQGFYGQPPDTADPDWDIPF